MNRRAFSPLSTFVRKVENVLDETLPEHELLERVRTAMGELIVTDAWLPAAAAKSHPVYYQQHLLHLDPGDRFSVVSFVWGPGQATPVHDHTTWGVIGVLRGAEYSIAYRRMPDGKLVPQDEERLDAGTIAAVSPRIGDIHKVRNAHEDRVSISIHVYGTDIGKVRRHAFDVAAGTTKEFISGYSKPSS